MFMAGKRQHTLPRFLLKGFASRESGDQRFTWVFRRERPPFETNITNVGAEGDFYGSAGKGSLDDEITRREGEFASLIDALRRSQAQVPDGSVQLLASFVLHVAARSSNVRDAFAEGADRVFGTLASAVSTPEGAAKVTKEHLRSHPKTIRKMVREKLTERLGRRPTRNELAIAEARAKPTFLAAIDEVAPAIYWQAAEVMRRLQSEIEPAIKRAHNTALPRVMSKAGRREQLLRKLVWTVVSFGEPVILGDIGPIALCDDGRYDRLLADMEKVQGIVLPISHHQAVVGSSGKVDLLPALLNQASAELSRDFFVSSTREVDPRLHQVLSARAAILSDEEWVDFERDLLE